VWNNADCLVLNRGQLGGDEDEDPYKKSSILHQWLFGYDVPDTVLLVRKDGSAWFLGTKKKIDFLRPAAEKLKTNDENSKSTIKDLHFLLRNKADNNAENYGTLWESAGITKINGKKRVVGVFVKERDENLRSGGIVGPWEAKLAEAAGNGDDAPLDLVDAQPGLAFVMSVKDDTELDLLKKSSVLSNKVMKHGYIKKMEEVIDSEQAITHEALAAYVDEILEDPGKISLKVPKEDVTSCYFPIVQSGGSYDIRVSAQSDDKNLSHDVIIVSLGARYKNYCSNIARTFFVDPPKRLSETYDVLLELQDACLEVMQPGNQLKQVYKTAVKFLQSRKGYEYLVDHLPKNLGFATGLDFREGSFTLNSKNGAAFKKGMAFVLSIGFSDLELTDSDKSKTPDQSPVRLRVVALL